MPHSAIGQDLRRLDGMAKATGKARFAGDLKLPRMLYGAILTSPHPHARVVRIDVGRVAAMIGVKTVVTGADAPRNRYGAPPDEYVLANDRVRYVGDEVAAVAALDEETARAALDLIEVEYEPVSAVFDPLEALEPGAPSLHDVTGNIASELHLRRGDVEAGWGGAHAIVERRFQTSAVHPGYLEPLGCVCDVDATGKITVYAGSQNPFQLRHAIARILGTPLRKVRVVHVACGGAFGGKLAEKPAAIGALLAQKAGRPVRLITSRGDSFVGGHWRVPRTIDLTLAAAADGRLVGKQTRLIADNGAYSRSAPAVVLSGAMRIDSLYRLENVRTDAYLVYTNRTPTGPFRGFGNPQMTFAVESAMDMLAEELGIDPLELRLRNATRAGDVSVHGWEIGSCALDDCLRQAADGVDWAERAQHTAGRGVGLAGAIHVSGSRQYGYEGSTALVRLDLDGSVRIATGEVDMGQGVPESLALIAAEELGARVEDVAVDQVDTDVSPYCLGSLRSRVTHVGGNAVRAAAQDLCRQIVAVAADRLEADPADLDVGQSRVWVRGSPDRGLELRRVAIEALNRPGGQPLIGVGSYNSPAVEPDPQTKYGNVSTAYSFAAHAAAVRVDAETGQVDVERFSAAHDLGKAINPLAARGQIEGGAAQGLGFALFEQALYAGDRLANDNLCDYKMPTACDGPPTVQAALIESEDPLGPFGAKGVGEIALVPTAAAIANAIAAATGVRCTSLPITPEGCTWLCADRPGRAPTTAAVRRIIEQSGARGATLTLTLSL